MENDNIYKTIGLVTISIIVVYIIFKTLKFQRHMIEGMTNSAGNKNNANNGSVFDVVAGKASSDLKSRNDKLQDILALSKYKSDYEDLIIEMRDFATSTLFSKVILMGSNVSKFDANAPIPNSIINDIDNINKLNEFVNSLQSAMEYLNKKNSNKGGYFS